MSDYAEPPPTTSPRSSGDFHRSSLFPRRTDAHMRWTVCESNKVCTQVHCHATKTQSSPRPECHVALFRPRSAGVPRTQLLEVCHHDLPDQIHLHGRSTLQWRYSHSKTSKRLDCYGPNANATRAYFPKTCPLVWPLFESREPSFGK
jgi:hypothetical protein